MNVDQAADKEKLRIAIARLMLYIEAFKQKVSLQQPPVYVIAVCGLDSIEHHKAQFGEMDLTASESDSSGDTHGKN